MSDEVDFANPPVVEVSFGLHFDRLTEMRSAHFGRFWSLIVEEYPETADRPTVSMPQLDPRGEWFPLPRVWFVHRDKTLLIQLQTDRFYLNWRRTESSGEYPRFSKMLPRFVESIRRWHQFVESACIGPLKITGCELSYINHMYVGDGWNHLSEASNVLVPLAFSSTSVGLPPPSGRAWLEFFELQAGRINAEIKTGKTSQPPIRDLLQFSLRAESGEKVSSVDESEKWLRDANRDLEYVFLRLTNPEAQQRIWKSVSN